MTTPTHSDTQRPDTQPTDRRSLLQIWFTVGTLGALGAAYGTLAAFMGRFLYPAGGKGSSWMYVTLEKDIAPGSAIVFTTPSGASINVARQGQEADSLIALSSTCPHLGCQVHWESANDRFFCPCHNGVFDPSGVATGGPPGDAGQTLPSYPLKIENGMVFIELTATDVAAGPGTVETPDRFRETCPIGPGHDPCLFPDRQSMQARSSIPGGPSKPVARG